MIFCIPSYGRAGKVSKFITEGLPMLGQPYLFVREKERDAYVKAYPKLSIMTIPNKCDTIAKTRAFMCQDMDTGVWAMVDDDITGFCVKKTTKRFGAVKRVGIEEARGYLDDIYNELTYVCKPDRIGVIGLPDRVTLARPHEGRSALPTRQFIFLTRAAAKAARYTMPLLSDIDCCLHWLTQENSVVYNHGNLGQASPPTAKTMTKGGCGEYRENNPDYYQSAYEELARRWPNIVTVTGGDGFGKEFTKRIAWSKAR